MVATPGTPSSEQQKKKEGNQQSTLVRLLCSVHLSFDLNISIPSLWLECLSKFPEFHSSCPCLNPYGNTSKISLSLISLFLIHPTKDGHYLLKVSSHLVLSCSDTFGTSGTSSSPNHGPALHI